MTGQKNDNSAGNKNKVKGRMVQDEKKHVIFENQVESPHKDRRRRRGRDEDEIEDRLFRELQELIGEEILIVTESDQLNLFGQSFRPVFTGTIYDVQQGHITLFPVIIKMINAPFFEFPTPLSFPFEKIAHFTPNFESRTRFPLT